MAMASQTGVAASKVLILVGAGMTGSILLRNGRLSDVLGELQELMKGVNQGQASGPYDMALIQAQAVYHRKYCQLLQLEQWDIATCGGRGCLCRMSCLSQNAIWLMLFRACQSSCSKFHQC